MDKSRYVSEAQVAYLKQYPNDGNQVSGPWVAGYVTAATIREAKLEQLERAIKTEQSGLAKALEQIRNRCEGAQDFLAGVHSMPWGDPEYMAEMGRLAEYCRDLASKALQAAGEAATIALHAQPHLFHQLELKPPQLSHLQTDAGPQQPFEIWRQELLELTAQKTGRPVHEIRLHEPTAYQWWADGFTPYATFRENYSL